MWVTIQRIQPGPYFIGELDHDPAWIKDLKFGDRIEFGPCHIINTEREDPNDITAKYSARCCVTDRVLKDGIRIGYLFRVSPEGTLDSGWRILAGDESDAYMNDSENLHYVSLGRVLSKDDSIIELLEAPEGSAFIRNGAGHFVPG